MSTLSQFVGGGGVKSVQRGVIQLLGIPAASVTISAVDPSKASVNYLGIKVTSNAIGNAFTRIFLNGPTEVVAERTYSGDTVIVSYEVIEFS